MFPFGQGFVSMSAPTKEMERLVKDNMLRHAGNPVTRWMMGNILLMQDPAGNIKINKAKSGDKVDGPVSLVMAIGTAMQDAAKEISGIKLSAGAQSDLTRIAKNEVTLNLYGMGFADFRGSLEQLVFSPQYTMSSDVDKRTLVKSLNTKFIEAGVQTLLQLPDYANLRQAYDDVQALKEQGIR